MSEAQDRKDQQTAQRALNALKQIALVGAQREQILERVAQQLAPEVRAELAISYARSGLGQESGALYAACVTNAVITANSHGLRVTLPAGLDEAIYDRAGIYTYGGIIGAKKRKPSEWTRSGRAKGKRIGNGGVRQVAPLQLFQLSDDQTARLSIRFAALFQIEAQRIINAGY